MGGGQPGPRGRGAAAAVDKLFFLRLYCMGTHLYGRSIERPDDQG